MKQIILKKLMLNYFKGIVSKEIEFGYDTSILAYNGVGKTTIKDAFLWLFFNKDSNDSADFNIKTYDHNEVVIPEVDHVVEAIVEVDGMEWKFKKVYKEKYVTKRGSTEKEFSGHTTDHYINDVPIPTLKEYQAKVASLIDEKLFKLITNPQFFPALEWKQRRAVLLQMAGGISNFDVAKVIGVNISVEKMIQELNSGKSEEEFKRQVNEQRKKIKDQLVSIPVRIDEANRQRPEAVNYEVLENELKEINDELVGLDTRLSDQNKTFELEQKKYKEKSDARYNAQLQSDRIKQDLLREIESNNRNAFADIHSKQSEVNKIETEVRMIASGISSKESQLLSLEQSISSQDNTLDKLRTEWVNENSKVFERPSYDTFNCTTCKQSLPENNVEEKVDQMEKDFNSNKQRILQDIIAKSGRIKEQKSQYENQKLTIETSLSDDKALLSEKEQSLSLIKEELSQLNINFQQPRPSNDILNEQLQINQEYQLLIQSIEFYDEELSQRPTISNSEIVEAKSKLNIRIQEINKILAQKTLIDQIERRVEELKSEEKVLNESKLQLDEMDFAIESFNKAKMNLLSERVNGMFRMVKFKLFETQINGGEVETCEIICKDSHGRWVPYSTANNATQINAGLDIINTLVNHYRVSAPVIIDGCESVFDFIPVSAQMIKLIASKQDREMRIELNDLKQSA